MTDFKRHLITAALPYANGLKHIGHLAGAYIPADIYSRFLRAMKKDVVFVCGSDEHGTAIPIQAMKEGSTPQAIIDKYHVAIKQDFEDLNISFDIYHRTSEPLHHETAREFFTTLHEKGALETKATEQFYDEATNTFLADRYIKGTCPKCDYDNAFGDQCEKCGTALSPDELINPLSTISGNIPIKKKTTHWYLPLGQHEAFLRKWILTEHIQDWRPTVTGQCKSWIEGGLQSRAVTRDLDWGVEVPLKDATGKVLYVWFDAPIGYISATKQWALNTGKDWKPYWQDKETQLVHFIGKDNIVFHCIIFPIMLQLHGNILPDNVPANEFLNLEGDKMSTSRNWKLEMRDYIDDFVKKENGGGQCVDMLRYYLTQIAPETKDSEFTWKGFQDAVNSELVNKFGNFVNRTFVLMHKLCNGKVPVFHSAIADATDQQLIADIASTKERVTQLIQSYKFRDALFEVVMLSDKGNKYMQKKEPWIVAKTLAENPEAQQQIDNCLHLCLQLTANLAILIHPFLPNTASKMLRMMKVVDKMLDWENAGKLNLLSVGYSLRAPELLFRKIDNEEITYQLDKLKAGLIKSDLSTAAANATTTTNGNKTNPSTMQATNSIPAQTASDNAPGIATTQEEAGYTAVKPMIVFDDFAKVDMRSGTIIAAEKVAKSDKLLNLTVDLGFEQRTILSGIAEHFTPEAVIGQQVVVVVNLAPRKMRGIESNGMILMSEDAAGKFHFLQTPSSNERGSLIS